MIFFNKTKLTILLSTHILAGCIYGTNTTCTYVQEDIDKGYRSCGPLPKEDKVVKQDVK